ncbi:RND transporter [Pseudolabrys taiwanensis]|uniref:RND transporter n=2 Tax=Pseudolabrys taiwanensis TaxID=331696 RepID=A0A345ZZB2_9HYPH|nr:efflux transporter outer membrane subunit [Pseudolabrys taiwanensis]AXK82259.1 RND transporter [Pseudolabrys taiwanensis]
MKVVLKRTRVFMLLAFALLPAGCAVGPDYRSPSLDLPTRWSGDKNKREPQPPVLAQWWRRLNDPLLNQLIDEAVQGNLDVAAAKARIREARASRRQAIGALFPSIEGSGSATRSRTATTTTDDITTPPSTGNQFQAGFDASWELDLFGANRRAVEAATYNVDASEDDLRSTLLTLIGDVASYYVDARGYQARAALARRTAISQRETAALTQNKFNAGSASAVDTAKALAQAASTEANVPTNEASYRESLHRLGVLLGRDPTALASRLARVTPIPAPRLPLPRGIPADVLTMRPDVRKAERQLAQYTAKIGQAEAALYPDVSLSGSVSTTALKLGDLGKNSTIGWSFGPTVSVPIFNGGKLRAAVEVAEAQRDEYHVAWRSAVLTALEDVENATVSLAQERIKIRSLTESAQRYGEAARLSHTLYENGSSSFLDVLDAERSQFSAEDTLLQSRVNIAKDYVALAKALGGGWDGAIDAGKPEVVDTDTGPHLPGALR